MNHVLVRRLRELFINETQSEVAERTGTSLSAVGKWLNGKAVPHIDSIIKICDEYEVSADWILGLSNEK